MGDDLWIKKIKDRLDDYSEPVPDSGWEQLEEELSVYIDPSIKKTGKMILFRRWTMAVVAALLLMISSISLWLLKSSVGDEIQHTSLPALVSTPDFLPEHTSPSEQINPSTPVYRVNKNAVIVDKTIRSTILAQQIEILTDNGQREEAESLETDNEIAVDGQIYDVSTVKIVDDVATQKENTEKKVERYRPSGKDKLHFQTKSTSAGSNKGWAIGLSVGNTGGLSLNNPADDRDYIQFNPANIINGERMDLSFTANRVLAIPKGQNLIFKDGMPYLQRNAKNIASIEHKQPLSFGISVRKELNKGFSIESGVTYTYLASDIIFEGSTDRQNQKLYYIGIPIRANWSFINTTRFTTYISAGGSVEKCVYGKIGNEKETVQPLQLSVTGAVGAQYNVNRRIGLYVEPGVSYFFDDGSMIQTIRKEKPRNFTLQAGVRLTY